MAWPGGKFTRFSQLKVGSNLNLIKRQRWFLGVNFQYKYISPGVDLVHPNTAGFTPAGKDFQYFNTALNFTYFSRLFGKPVIYGVSVMVDGSEKHFERLKGMAFGTMVLKADARTKMTAGVVVNVDPTSLVPVLPTFSYEHKFHDDWSVDVILPKYLYLRKFVSNNGRISLGTEFDQTSFYLYGLNPANLSQRYQYQQLDLNTGVTYEHLLGKYFIFMVRGGLRFTPNGKVFEKSNYGSPIYQTSPQPAPFFNVGLSFNPFLRRNK